MAQPRHAAGSPSATAEVLPHVASPTGVPQKPAPGPRLSVCPVHQAKRDKKQSRKGGGRKKKTGESPKDKQAATSGNWTKRTGKNNFAPEAPGHDTGHPQPRAHRGRTPAAAAAPRCSQTLSRVLGRATPGRWELLNRWEREPSSPRPGGKSSRSMSSELGNGWHPRLAPGTLLPGRCP